MGAFFLGSLFSLFLPLKSLKMRVRYGIPSYIVLNDYQIKEVNDTEKGLIFKQILTQKNLKFRILDSGFAGSGVKELKS